LRRMLESLLEKNMEPRRRRRRSTLEEVEE
jgi:hypothetical protein